MPDQVLKPSKEGCELVNLSEVRANVGKTFARFNCKETEIPAGFMVDDHINFKTRFENL